MTPNILVIAGTVRQKRISDKLAKWYIQQAKQAAPEAQYELLDIAELNLPLFDLPMSPMMHDYNELQESIAKKIAWADGFVFVTAEYNHSIPGALKNFIDYVYAEWNHKAAAFVSYGGHGGVRSVEHLAQILAELKVVAITSTGTLITIPTPWEAFNEDGSPKEGYLRGNIEKQLEELLWWTQALKAARR